MLEVDEAGIREKRVECRDAVPKLAWYFLSPNPYTLFPNSWRFLWP
jgi:hypothetical protein